MTQSTSPAPASASPQDTDRPIDHRPSRLPWWRPRFTQRWTLRTFGTPAIALGLIAAVGYTHHGAHDPTSWDAYHDAAKLAIDALPTNISAPSGDWMAREVEVPQPALDLLRPNALRNLVFTDYSPQSLRQKRQVSLLVVQCRSAADMQGHYPPKCYPAQGATLVQSMPRQWQIPSADPTHPPLRVSGMEYHFAEPDQQGRLSPAGGSATRTGTGNPAGRRRIVLNFLLVPGEGLAADMQDVFANSDDFQKRHRGAAQVQLVFGPGGYVPGQKQRDAIFLDLLSPAVPALRTLMNAENLPDGDAENTPEHAGPPPALAFTGEQR